MARLYFGGKSATTEVERLVGIACFIKMNVDELRRLQEMVIAFVG